MIPTLRKSLRLLFPLLPIAILLAACRISAPTMQSEAEIHSSKDIAVNAEQLRLRMRALVSPLCGRVVESADQIIVGTTNRQIQRAALLWKIEAVPALREALFRPTPLTALFDTWVLTFQMVDYFESGSAKDALGDAHGIAVATSKQLEAEISRIAASMTVSGDVSKAEAAARKWAAEHPIRQSISSRESTLSRATEREVADAFSTSEAVAEMAITVDDLNRRLEIYSAQLLEQARWQAELFARDLGAQNALPLAETAVRSATETAATLKRLEPTFEDTLAIAKTAPDLVVRERAVAIQAARDEISRTIDFLQAERIAVLIQITKEREAALTELHQTIAAERKLLSDDARGIVDKAMLRLTILTVAFLLAAFIGINLHLLIARRIFAPRQKT